MKYKVVSGSKSVTTPGTRVSLTSTSTWARALRLSAPDTNVGTIFFGGNTVTLLNGLFIEPGQTLSFADLHPVGDGATSDLPTINLADCYIDSLTALDKLTFVYLDPVT